MTYYKQPSPKTNIPTLTTMSNSPNTLNKEERKQLNVAIRADQFDKLQEILPYGVKARVFETMVDLLINLLEHEHGDAYLGLLMSGEVNLPTLMKLQSTENAKA